MRRFIPLILFILLAIVFYLNLGLDKKTLPSPLIDKAFPGLVISDFYTDKKYSLTDKLKNNISIVNVWASWCATCRAEHAMLDNIAKTNTVQMIGINYKDTKKDANIFLKTLGNPFDYIVFDNKGQLGLELGVYAVPETFLVDQNSLIRFKHIGEVTNDIWQQQILPLIRQLQKK